MYDQYKCRDDSTKKGNPHILFEDGKYLCLTCEQKLNGKNGAGVHSAKKHGIRLDGSNSKNNPKKILEKPESILEDKTIECNSENIQEQEIVKLEESELISSEIQESNGSDWDLAEEVEKILEQNNIIQKLEDAGFPDKADALRKKLKLQKPKKIEPIQEPETKESDTWLMNLIIMESDPEKRDELMKMWMMGNMNNDSSNSNMGMFMMMNNTPKEPKESEFEKMMKQMMLVQITSTMNRDPIKEIEQVMKMNKGKSETEQMMESLELGIRLGLVKKKGKGLEDKKLELEEKRMNKEQELEQQKKENDEKLMDNSMQAVKDLADKFNHKQ